MENIVGQRIRHEREKRNWTQSHLAKKLFLPDASYISKIENGIRKVSPEELLALTDIFDCTLQYLIGQSDVPLSPEIIKRRERLANINVDDLKVDDARKVNIPILGIIRAGLPILTEENFSGELEVPANVGADFALEVRGNSMVGAGILEGDYALCRESIEPQTGQIIVALHDEGSISEATLKYYFNNNGHPCLKAANPNYPDIDYREGYRCAGHMVALIRQDCPSYQVYKDYLTISGHEEWTEIIEKAIGYGITPEQLSTNLDMQWQMIEKMRAIKKRKS